MNILVWLGSAMMHPAIYPNMQSLAGAFAAMGHRVITCDTSREEEVLAAYTLLQEEQVVDLSIGPNSLGMRFVDSQGAVIDPYENIDTLHISLLLDEPFNPVCNGYEHKAKHHLLTCLDRSDKIWFSRLQLTGQKHKLFLPLGGTANGFTLEELLERKRKSPYGAVFSAGKFNLCQSRPRWREYGAKAALANVLDDVLQLLEEEPLSVTDAVQTVLAARDMDEEVYFAVLAHFFPVLLSYIKGWRRQKLLSELIEAGVNVDIFGGGWNSDDFAGRAKIHGEVSYAEMLNVMTYAKVVVNDEACFNNGAHDRVFTAMLNGAAVVSEYSTYLAEEFTVGQDLYLFDWQHIKAQLEICQRLLNDDRLREKMAISAYRKASKRHTWEQRARRLLEVVEMLEFKYKFAAGNS